jgi:hypothetical protein
MGLVDYAIDYAAESGDFDGAFALARQAGADAKLPDVHLKHAMHLEARLFACSASDWVPHSLLSVLAVPLKVTSWRPRAGSPPARSLDGKAMLHFIYCA